MNNDEIKAKLAEMTKAQRKDWYYLANQAMAANNPAMQRMEETFGSALPGACLVVMSECHNALTSIEQESYHDHAKQELNAALNLNENAADEYLEHKKKQLSPLLAIRTQKGLTQTRLAELSGINARQIRKIETGEIKTKNITIGTITALARAIGVEIEDLIGE